MLERLGGLAPLAGSLTLLVADGHAARAWRGESDPSEPIQAFHAARDTEGSTGASVALGEAASGWLLRLGAPPRDATVFRRAAHQLAIVGPYRERKDEEAEPPPLSSKEIERLLTQSESKPLGTLAVPSGRLIIANAWSNLSNEPSKAPATLPPELRAQMDETSAQTAEKRAKFLQNLDVVRQHIEAAPLEERADFLKLIKDLLQHTAEAASASLELFGGRSTVIRSDTGDVMLVVPARTYELALLEVPCGEDTLGILRIEPV